MRWFGVWSGVVGHVEQGGACSVLADLGSAIWGMVAWFMVCGLGRGVGVWFGPGLPRRCGVERAVRVSLGMGLGPRGVGFSGRGWRGEAWRGAVGLSAVWSVWAVRPERG